MIGRRALLLCAALSMSVGASGIAAASDQSAAPLVYHKATRRTEVELRLPKALDAWPALRETLAKSDTAKLNGFVRAGENNGPGRPGRRNWRTIRYQLAGTTPRLVSAIRYDDRDTGGAHPMPTVSGVIWDQRTKSRLALSALFRADADPGPLDKALCDAVKAAKAAREGAVPLDDKLWRCPLFSQAQAVLAPSTVAGRAGGLIVLINPDEVGPYVEGIYKVVLPPSTFRKALRRPYLTEFAGEPSEAAAALANPDSEVKPVKAVKPLKAGKSRARKRAR